MPATKAGILPTECSQPLYSSITYQTKVFLHRAQKCSQTENYKVSPGWKAPKGAAVPSKGELEQGSHLLQQFPNSHGKHERRQSLGLLQEFHPLLSRGICITCPPCAVQTRSFCHSCLLGFPHFTPLFRNNKKPSSHILELQKQTVYRWAQQGVFRPGIAVPGKAHLTLGLLSFLHSTELHWAKFPLRWPSTTAPLPTCPQKKCYLEDFYWNKTNRTLPLWDFQYPAVKHFDDDKWFYKAAAIQCNVVQTHFQ